MFASLFRRCAPESRLIGILLAAIAALLVAGCQTPKYPPAPNDAQVGDYNYRIGPLDTVNIIVWRNPDVSMSVPVRPDGKITTPLVRLVTCRRSARPRRSWNGIWRRRCPSTFAIRWSPSS